MERSVSSSGKPRVLFILHLPPPVHGASLVGSFLRDSALVNGSFEASYVNLSASTTLEQTGRFGLNKIGSFLRIFREVRRMMQAGCPDLVYMTPSSTMPGLLKDALIARMVRRRCGRIVLHFHNKGVSSCQDRFIDDRLYRLLFRDADVILLSRLLYPDIRKYVLEERVHFCPNGISVPELHPSAGSVPRILFLSNMIRTKGVSVLVDACRILKDRGVPFRCSLVGALSADYPGDSLVAEFREKGVADNVVYEGPRYGDEKWEAFSKADLFVLPTFYANECFPLVILEAMGAGLPVVTTDEGALPEMVRDGVDGIICPKRDPAALADALERLLVNPALRSGMGESGKARFQDLFTLDRFEERMVGILKVLFDA